MLVVVKLESSEFCVIMFMKRESGRIRKTSFNEPNQLQHEEI